MTIRERKYKIEPDQGRLVKRSNSVPIPEDEPLFILRAKDRNALPALSFYVALCEFLEHRAEVMNSVEDFRRFAAKNPDKMSEPNI